MTAPFPWGAVLHTGLHLLRLSPKDFWALTPLEFIAMTGAASHKTAFSRAALEDLIRRFPDDIGLR